METNSRGPRTIHCHLPASRANKYAAEDPSAVNKAFSSNGVKERPGAMDLIRFTIHSGQHRIVPLREWLPGIGAGGSGGEDGPGDNIENSALPCRQPKLSWWRHGVEMPPTLLALSVYPVTGGFPSQRGALMLSLLLASSNNKHSSCRWF